MPTTYKIVADDTYNLISRKVYGTEVYANSLSSANPGVLEPLIAGTTINVPALPERPINKTQTVPTGNASEVSILIDGQLFRFWDAVRIVRSIDAIDIVEFSAPFSIDIPGFKELFRPFKYNNITILVNGNIIITGTLVSVTPVVTEQTKIVSLGCYSLPGVLNDCTIPASSYPENEFTGQGLRDITNKVIEPFGIKSVFESEQGAVFETVSINPSTRVLAFLIDLAQQRDLIISSSNTGELVFLKSISSGVPVASIEQGASPLLSVTPNFSPQDYYSHITGIEQVELGTKGSQFTIKNSRLAGVIRPLTFEIKDTIKGDVKQAVQSRLGRMYAKSISYTVTLSTWHDPSGKLWEKNTIIKVKAPGAMIYSNYDFLIRSVQLEKDSTKEVATLDLVIPGSFNGVIPDTLPWDD